MKRQYGGRNVLFENPIKRAKKGKSRLESFLIKRPSKEDLDIVTNLDKFEQYQHEIIRLLLTAGSSNELTTDVVEEKPNGVDIDADFDATADKLATSVEDAPSPNSKNVLKQILPNGLIAILPTSIGGGSSSSAVADDDQIIRCFFAHEWKHDDVRMTKGKRRSIRSSAIRKTRRQIARKERQQRRRRRMAKKNKKEEATDEVDGQISMEDKAVDTSSKNHQNQKATKSSSLSMLQVVEVIYKQRDGARSQTYDADSVRLHSFRRPGGGGK